ncbi:MAG: hypothetical protein WCS01_14050 [bacterium]
MKSLFDDKQVKRRNTLDIVFLNAYVLCSLAMFITTHVYLDRLSLLLAGYTLSFVLFGIALIYIRTLRLRKENKEIYNLLMSLKDTVEGRLPNNTPDGIRQPADGVPKPSV